MAFTAVLSAMYSGDEVRDEGHSTNACVFSKGGDKLSDVCRDLFWQNVLGGVRNVTIDDVTGLQTLIFKLVINVLSLSKQKQQ